MAFEKKKSDKKPIIKFVSEYTHGFSFILALLDADGKAIWNTDREGGGKVRAIKEFHFSKVPGRDPSTGKISAKFTRHVMVCNPDELGDLYDRVVAELTAKTKNPDNKLFSEADYQKKVNREAYLANQRVRELEDSLDEKDQYIKDLEAKLGLSLPKKV